MDRTSVYRALRLSGDDEGVSFTVCRLSVSDETRQTNRDYPDLAGPDDVQRFERQGHSRNERFNFESLILAQNERWRQA